MGKAKGSIDPSLSYEEAVAQDVDQLQSGTYTKNTEPV